MKGPYVEARGRGFHSRPTRVLSVFPSERNMVVIPHHPLHLVNKVGENLSNSYERLHTVVETRGRAGNRTESLLRKNTSSH